jgi:hypothetical protein
MCVYELCTRHWILGWLTVDFVVYFVRLVGGPCPRCHLCLCVERPMRSVLTSGFGGIDDGFCYRVCAIDGSRHHVRYGVCSYAWRGPGAAFVCYLSCFGCGRPWTCVVQMFHFILKFSCSHQKNICSGACNASSIQLCRCEAPICFPHWYFVLYIPLTQIWKCT